MPLTGVCTPLTAFITNVMVLLGLFCGVQPNRMFSFGPTVDPFGPQPCSAITPVRVVGSKAPWVTVGVVMALGSVTRTPPSQVIAPGNWPKLQPAGLLAMTGSDV